jgi:hypothetical protein
MGQHTPGEVYKKVKDEVNSVSRFQTYSAC